MPARRPSYRSAIPAALGAAALQLPAVVHAQSTAAGTYPARPIRMVVPYGAGGVSDILGRTIAARMSELLAQNIVVDNRAGAGGVVGSEFVAKATPDGYTILFSSISVYSIIPHMRRQMPFDPDTAFTPIGGVAQSSTIMAIGSAQPMKTVKEVIERAKSGKGKISYGSSGIGSVGHLTGEILGQLAGTELLHVPFKSAAMAYPDAMNGTITMVIDSLPSAMQHLKSGSMRPLAMLSAVRDPAMPDVPTIAEAGFPEAVLVFWSGLHGPAGLTGAVTQRLAEVLGRSLQAPELRERFAALGALPLPMTGKELANRIRTDRERLGKVMKAAGIQPE
jgi:tripartite-type tricarboxylate transporter receptor subunit TctC